MVSSRPSPDFPEYNARTAGVWDSLAEWWDDEIGAGNAFQDLLIEPNTGRMLALQPGERVLDVACGAGRFARRMADAGATVVAIDHAARFIERARQRSAGYEDRITYHVADAADRDALLALGEGRFDAAVCTMALMDMAEIEPLISTLPRLLRPDGRFVFSVTHPVFNSGTVRRVAEEQDRDGELVARYSVAVTDYATPFTYRGVGVPGQPVPQHYFHRPVSMLMNTCFEHGFMLDWMEEPTLPPVEVAARRLGVSYADLWDIPPVLVARMRLVGAPRGR